jgi:hypothetical protein
MEVKLMVLEGKHKDREIPLPETIFLIGRDRQCHIRPHCQLVSQLHCAIAAWGGKVRVRDLKSRNGTFLNGQPIRGEVVVKDGDKLQVGTLVFAFEIRNEKGLPVPAPIKDVRKLQWLLDSPSDSSVLGAATEIDIAAVPVEPAADPDDSSHGPESVPARGKAARSRGSKAVSAGQHLRAYVESRKKPRPTGPSKLG